MGGNLSDVATLEQDVSAAGARAAEDGHHQRRLAGAVSSDQRDDLAGIDVEIDALQRLDLAIGSTKAADGEEGSRSRGHVPLSSLPGVRLSVPPPPESERAGVGVIAACDSLSICATRSLSTPSKFDNTSLFQYRTTVTPFSASRCVRRSSASL